MIPRDPDRSPERLDAALAFISRLVRKGLHWAEGGHVPAFREVFESEEYRKLSPQSDYASAVENLVFDPLAWYSGSGSNLETNAGAAFKPVVAGTQAPEQGLRDVPRLPGPHEHEPASPYRRSRRGHRSRIAVARRLAHARPERPRPARRPAGAGLHRAVLHPLRAVPVLAGGVGAVDVVLRRLAGRRRRRGRGWTTTASCSRTRTSGPRCGTRRCSRSSACRRWCCSRSASRCS